MGGDWLEEHGFEHASWLVRNWKTLTKPVLEMHGHRWVTFILTPRGLQYANACNREDKRTRRQYTRGKRYPMFCIERPQDGHLHGSRSGMSIDRMRSILASTVTRVQKPPTPLADEVSKFFGMNVRPKE